MTDQHPVADTATRSEVTQVDGPGPITRVRRFVVMFGKALYDEWFQVEVTALAAQIAYSLLLAIPSLALIIMLIAAYIDRQTGLPIADRLREIIENNSPEEIRQLLTYVVDTAVERADTTRVSLGLLLAFGFGLWSGSGGVNALVNASNRAYGLRETRRFHQRRIRALILTVVTSIIVVAGLILFILSRSFGPELADRVHLGAVFDWVWRHLREPLILFSLYGSTVGLYRFGPAHKPPWRYILPGALVANLLFFLSLQLFGFLLTYANPGSPYGATGSVIVLLIFLYLTAASFILGAVVNGILYRHFCADDHVPELWRS